MQQALGVLEGLVQDHLHVMTSQEGPRDPEAQRGLRGREHLFWAKTGDETWNFNGIKMFDVKTLFKAKITILWYISLLWNDITRIVIV